MKRRPARPRPGQTGCPERFAPRAARAAPAARDGLTLFTGPEGIERRIAVIRQLDDIGLGQIDERNVDQQITFGRVVLFVRSTIADQIHQRIDLSDDFADRLHIVTDVEGAEDARDSVRSRGAGREQKRVRIEQPVGRSGDLRGWGRENLVGHQIQSVEMSLHHGGSARSGGMRAVRLDDDEPRAGGLNGGERQGREPAIINQKDAIIAHHRAIIGSDRAIPAHIRRRSCVATPLPAD